ncbi:MAG: hypothetical protein HDKAJFGB_01816 [Anaerolineae bacterium]|nr:hypothetical protein [Anaerolineae bacterium]RIK17612.1 MAG: hypothetical protein DCC52_16750 [Chloroflexota bacterium]
MKMKKQSPRQKKLETIMRKIAEFIVYETRADEIKLKQELLGAIKIIEAVNAKLEPADERG